MEKKEYTGSVYIGVVGAELEYGICRDSLDRLIRRHGDESPAFGRATKGFEARQQHLNRFMESGHDFILLLDSDMVYKPDTLERLRNHKMPYVTGSYARRQYDPVVPVWFNDAYPLWPTEPSLDKIPDEGLIPRSASGWGCILLHREVVEAVRKLLKGEPEIIEDDMDIWPYDLERIMHAVNGLQELAENPTGKRSMHAAIKLYASILKEEIRPLRGTKHIITGSDIRFPFFARAAGYQLMQDCAVRPGHVLFYPLNYDDYAGMSEDYYAKLREVTDKAVAQGRQEWIETMARLEAA